MVASIAIAKVIGPFILAKVKACQTVLLVLADVRVHDVQQHEHARAVGFVDEGLELLWGAAAGSWGKGVGHVVAEAAIVWVLLQCRNRLTPCCEVHVCAAY